MLLKLIWILLPLLLYAVYLAVATSRGRMPSGASFKPKANLFLALYLLTSSGLASQQLSVSVAAPEARPVEAVVRYHELSSDSRSSTLKRVPSVDGGAPPAPFKHYPDARHIALDRVPATARTLGEALHASAMRSERLRLDELGEMLYLSAGITARRGGTALRAAPSSGALFPSELYVIACAIDGLPSGLYHYDPEQHQLDALGAAPSAFGAPDAEDADAVVLLSAVFRRTMYKYHDRAYRYALADAGHLLENLRLAGNKAGMHPRLLPQFDEALAAKAIGVDGREEGVLAVMDLRRAAASSVAAPSHGRFVVAPVPDSTTDIIAMVHQATSLRLVSDDVQGDVIVLPPPQPATRDVHDTIVRRRSQRRFSGEPVPLASLSSMLAEMALPSQLSNAINIHLIVHRVAGLPPGVYRYLPQHALKRVRAGNFTAAAQSAALSQEVIGGAAVVLVLSAERGSMLAEGARGYRHAYIEAGMLSERWLLGAVARELAACPVGAFYDDEAAALIGVDRRNEWVLHFAALGRGRD